MTGLDITQWCQFHMLCINPAKLNSVDHKCEASWSLGLVLFSKDRKEFWTIYTYSGLFSILGQIQSATIAAHTRFVSYYKYSKTCLKRPLRKKRPKLVFKTDYRWMQVKSIAECSKGSILQYFQPSLSYHLSLRSLFCLFLNGRLRQVLL